MLPVGRSVLPTLSMNSVSPLNSSPLSASYRQTEPGVWNVMPVYEGDHMSLQGGMTKFNNIRPFYLELLETIDALEP